MSFLALKTESQGIEYHSYVIIILKVIYFCSSSFINTTANQVCEHQEQVFLISQGLLQANVIMICNCYFMLILSDICTD